MSKLAHQTSPTPVDDLDTSTKLYSDNLGGTGAAAAGAKLLLGLAADQDNVSANDTVAFTSALENVGDITVNGSGVVTLPAGRSFLLATQLGTTGSGDRVTYNLYDNTADQFFTIPDGISYAANASVTNSSARMVMFPITVGATPQQVSVRIVSVDTSPNVRSNFGSWFMIMEIGVNNSIVEETILESASDTISVAGLNGDAHGIYDIELHLLLANDGNTHVLDLDPNGGTPSSIHSRYYANFQDVPQTITDDIQLVSANDHTDREVAATIRSHVARTWAGVPRRRTFSSDAHLSYSDSPYNVKYNCVGSWDDVTANFTSFDVVTNQPNGFLAGSRATVRLVTAASASTPGSSGADSRLWATPTGAHANDDEFESTTLGAAWNVSPAASASAIDPYANFTTGGPRLALHTDRRPSWLMVQPYNVGTYISKAITVPTNVLVWAELTFNLAASVPSNHHRVGLGLAATDTGDIDSNNRLVLWLSEADSGVVTAQFDMTEGGSTTADIGAAPTDTDRQGTALTYVALHKIGSTVHAWVGTNAGSWIYIGQRTYAGAALDRVFLDFFSDGATAPGNPILGVNFIRFVESATFLP